MLPVLRLLGLPPARVLAAVLAGAAALGSAVALTATSAWLIARASQQPPVLALTVAVAAVRALGISRGLLRYLDRLVSHDLALRGMARLRERLYASLADGDGARLLALRRGDLLARVGADVDSVGDAVVRGLLPMAVAAVVAMGSVALLAAFLPVAALVLAAGLVVGGVLAPWWAGRSRRAAGAQTVAAGELTAIALAMLDGAAELRVSGGVPSARNRLRNTERLAARAADHAARPLAGAAALGQLAVGLAVVGVLAVAVPATSGGLLDPTELAVVALTPLAAFEAVLLLPAATVNLQRSREAARRVLELFETSKTGAPAPPTPSRADGRTTGILVAHDLAVGWPQGPALAADVNLEIRPGDTLAVVGPSGVGKTTLLLTLAGLLPPKAGTVLLDGEPAHLLPREVAAGRAAFTAEDAHVFDTTVLENLRVARGDVTREEAAAVLATAGLGDWLADLPSGLDTMLGADATAISGGQRRRLLLARALLAPAPVLLLDEPTEHLDGGALVLSGLLDGHLAPGRAVVVATHLSPSGKVLRIG